jgi:hypothetical protein
VGRTRERRPRAAGMKKEFKAVCSDRRTGVTARAAQLWNQHRRAERAVSAEPAHIDVGGAEARRRRPVAGEVEDGAPGLVLNIGVADIIGGAVDSRAEVHRRRPSLVIVSVCPSGDVEVEPSNAAEAIAGEEQHEPVAREGRVALVSGGRIDRHQRDGIAPWTAATAMRYVEVLVVVVGQVRVAIEVEAEAIIGEGRAAFLGRGIQRRPRFTAMTTRRIRQSLGLPQRSSVRKTYRG